jgi:hypothetical protein
MRQAQPGATVEQARTLCARPHRCGKTYSQLSAESQANPANAALKQQVETIFQGTTLRGLLLNAYAFWQIGQIALIASIVSFAGAAIMLILTVLGFWHRRRTPAEAELGAA